MNNISLPPPQLAELLGRMDLFRGMPGEVLKNLAAASREICIKRNEFVFHKGSPAESLHVVISGQIKVLLPMGGKAFKTLQVASRGESLAVASAWLGENHIAQAVANKDSYLLVIDRKTLLSEVQRNCHLAARMLSMIAQHKQDLMRDMENCAPRSSLQRVACYLLQYRANDEEFDYEILLPSTKCDIASKLSLTQETLSRVLHHLKEMGVIHVEGRLIRVLDSNRLASIRLADCALESQ